MNTQLAAAQRADLAVKERTLDEKLKQQVVSTVVHLEAAAYDVSCKLLR